MGVPFRDHALHRRRFLCALQGLVRQREAKKYIEADALVGADALIMTRGAVDTAERREAIAVMCERARLDVARTPPSRGPFVACKGGYESVT